MCRAALSARAIGYSVLVGISMKANVCIVTFPLEQAGITPLSNLAKLLSRLADRVFVVSGGLALANLKLDGNVQIIKTDHEVSSRLLMRIINYTRTQLRILGRLIVIFKKTDLFVFFIGGEDLFLSILALRLLGKKVVLMPGGVIAKVYSVKNDALAKFLPLLVGINSFLASGLIVYSHLMSQELNLVRFERKTVIAHEHFVDFTRFKTIKRIDQRFDVVGYIGRLSEEKGILNMIEAIPLVLKEKADACFAICGEGSLTNEVESRIKNKALEARVKLTKWIAHEDVPQYLNELKLLVLPSFTEGLPNVILEAMACGTPVLTMPVGMIPDIITDGETGFLLKSNHPEHIAVRITSVLGNPRLLQEVSARALRYVREEFSEEIVLESWRRILENTLCVDEDKY